tara:strand:+ start:1274 stop:1531 length:258 start_codon:yes stop_codon:yes gene_type:complete
MAKKSAKQSNAPEKSRITAALLAFFLGIFGVHKFYLGYTSAGFIQLVLSCCGIGGIIAFIEFIIYLMKSDEEFQKIYVDNEKAWF